MEVTRRGFLGGLAALGAAAAVPWHIAKHLELLPNLWGDGVHDDSPGLKALINGEKVYDVQAHAPRQNEAGVIWLRNGTYAISEPIDLTGAHDTVIENSTFRFHPGAQTRALRRLSFPGVIIGPA